jgi:hypothetical protein
LFDSFSFHGRDLVRQLFWRDYGLDGMSFLNRVEKKVLVMSLGGCILYASKIKTKDKMRLNFRLYDYDVLKWTREKKSFVGLEFHLQFFCRAGLAGKIPDAMINIIIKLC